MRASASSASRSDGWRARSARQNASVSSGTGGTLSAPPQREHDLVHVAEQQVDVQQLEPAPHRSRTYGSAIMVSP